MNIYTYIAHSYDVDKGRTIEMQGMVTGKDEFQAKEEATGILSRKGYVVCRVHVTLKGGSEPKVIGLPAPRMELAERINPLEQLTVVNMAPLTILTLT